MPNCEQCGVTSQGAVVRDFGDDTLCIECAAPGECTRCGAETSELTLTGEWLCGRCQDARSDQQESRELGQQGLGGFE